MQSSENRNGPLWLTLAPDRKRWWKPRRLEIDVRLKGKRGWKGIWCGYRWGIRDSSWDLPQDSTTKGTEKSVPQEDGSVWEVEMRAHIQSVNSSTRILMDPISWKIITPYNRKPWTESPSGPLHAGLMPFPSAATYPWTTTSSLCRIPFPKPYLHISPKSPIKTWFLTLASWWSINVPQLTEPPKVYHFS